MWSTGQHWPAGQVNEINHKSTVYMQNTFEDSHYIGLNYSQTIKEICETSLK